MLLFVLKSQASNTAVEGSDNEKRKTNTIYINQKCSACKHFC
jgi:hypothetical protein